MTITTLYALPLAVMALVLWADVTRTRAAMGISIGDAGDGKLLLRIRRHANFIETVPLALILLALAETRGVDVVWLHSAGALVVVGRSLHALGLKVNNPSHPLRILGNSAGLFATLILIVTLAVSILA